MDYGGKNRRDGTVPPVTAPEGYTVSLRGFDSDEDATEFGHLISVYIGELSRYIDLSGLDGVTIAYDFAEALGELDRGYETSHRLVPTDGCAIGVAMTPVVLRDGKIKSHIVMAAGLAKFLDDAEGQDFSLALHMLAHECAHVEVTSRFDTAFPEFLLSKTHSNPLDTLRWEVILVCWDEYAATSISAKIGEDRSADYEELFLEVLGKTQRDANNSIKDYRIHGKVDQILTEVFAAYGNLMKFACYLIGDMSGRNLALDDLDGTKKALDGHWFESFFYRLWEVCGDIADAYGEWTDIELFEALGTLAESIIADNGVTVIRQEGNKVYVDIPYSPGTMPD